ncbi:type II secretion system F family protein [Massilia endophytica]|uniref:type II secretion system F family protein n=1 Tax=Massilia endophytica TaxID=2899220 RepID=UPI001E3F46F0|nr:type II secretion system F family protein [Massilia endophytica]UGQ46173.1 type II secretion system F family protein [Massilia endophytica]
MDMALTFFYVFLFASVIFAVEAAWLWWQARHGGSSRRIARRLQLMSGRADGAERISILKQRRYAASPLLEDWLRRIPRMAVLDRWLMQSGQAWQVGRFLAAWAALVIVSWSLLAMLSVPLLAFLVMGGLCAAAPMALLFHLRAARLKKILEQLPDAADFLSRALRAGHSFANVLQMAGHELPEPIGGEFRTCYEEINYGVPMNEALHNLAIRIPLTDLRYLVIAVLIQRESGGNLAELLGNISRMTRARLKLVGQVRVLSAEGRLSAWILATLPVGVAAVMSITSPKYIGLLWTDPAGPKLLWYAAGGVLFGVLWMRNTIRIRV